MIEILHDLIYQNRRNYGGNYPISHILGDAGFVSLTGSLHASSVCVCVCVWALEGSFIRKPAG